MTDAREELRKAAERLRWSEIVALEVPGTFGQDVGYRELWPIDAAPLAELFDIFADLLDRYHEEGLYPMAALQFARAIEEGAEQALQTSRLKSTS